MKTKISHIGALGSALFASSCCILPLVAVIFGLSIGGSALLFATLRPYLLVVTYLILGFSYYTKTN